MTNTATRVVCGATSWEMRERRHCNIIDIAQQLMRTEKTRMPTVEMRDLPTGYLNLSSSVSRELAAVIEIIIPPIMSRQESAREDIIVYDADVEMAKIFENKRNKFIPKEQYVAKRIVKLTSLVVSMSSVLSDKLSN